MKKTLLTVLSLGIASLTAVASDYTFVFDGDNAVFGVERQTTLSASDLKFSEEIKGTEAGVDFSIRKASETGYGFALVNAGGTNAGILVYSALKAETHITPEVTLTVPGGKITDVKLWMSGVSLVSLDISFNGQPILSENAGNLYTWTWTGAATESVSFTWDNTFSNRFIHKIEVTYTEDLQGKKPSGLSFSKTSMEAVMGQKITYPTLLNPNKLPVTWSSTDESVATVDSEGAVTLLKGGNTAIVASTEGNDEYAAGNVRYELAVIPSASNLKEMKEMAPAPYDRVYVDFPMTVTYPSLSYAYVIDPEDNAGYICDLQDAGSTSSTPRTIYKVGDVIPAGWIATNGTIVGSLIWQGLPGKVTETAEVSYPKVEAVTPEDVDRVVTLVSVTFAGSTPVEKGYGTTDDGTEYEFQNTYGLSALPGGKYDVTAIVHYAVNGSTVYYYLAPISYTPSSPVGVAGIEAAGDMEVWYDLHGRRVAEPGKGLFIRSQGGKFTKVMKR